MSWKQKHISVIREEKHPDYSTRRLKMEIYPSSENPILIPYKNLPFDVMR